MKCKIARWAELNRLAHGGKKVEKDIDDGDGNDPGSACTGSSQRKCFNLR